MTKVARALVLILILGCSATTAAPIAFGGGTKDLAERSPFGVPNDLLISLRGRVDRSLNLYEDFPGPPTSGLLPHFNKALLPFFFPARAANLVDIPKRSSSKTQAPPDVNGPSSLPIPAAAWLFGSALFGLLGIARHKQRARPAKSPESGNQSLQPALDTPHS